MRKENLVFLPDSPYCQWIIERSEQSFPGRNRYVSICANEPKYPYSNLEVKGTSRDELLALSEELNSYSQIILHYHFDLLGFLLERAKIPSERVTWVLWSGDLYNTSFFDQPIYFSQTLVHAKGNVPETPTGTRWLKELIKFWLGKPGYFAYRKSFQRIGTIASLFEMDVAHASRIFRKDYRVLPFALLSFEELLKGTPQDLVSQPGEKILLGHAGVPENNHLELFDRIAELEVKRPLVCPLSYGNQDYIQLVQSRGVERFGEQLEIITTFMPRLDYYRKLAEMGFAVFNTRVQQAFGNILGLLYLGVKVFLNRENSIYPQLRKMGIIVFPMDELTGQNLQQPLATTDIAHNRRILEESFAEEKIIEYYSSLLDPAFASRERIDHTTLGNG